MWDTIDYNVRGLCTLGKTTLNLRLNYDHLLRIPAQVLE